MTADNDSSSKEDKSDKTETTEEQREDDIDDGEDDSVIEEGDENEDEEEEAQTTTESDAGDEPPTIDEDDEEVRLAMEMALAAVKNPKLSPDELRRLVTGQSAEDKQKEFVKQMEEKKARQKIKEQEDAQKRWNDQKDSMFGWFYGQSSEEYQWAQQKAKYADKIKSDKQVRETRKAIKAKRKNLKALRLQGNRVETRHIFKRQRMEKHLLEVEEAIDKHIRHFCQSTTYDAATYAKAMMKATKKWSKQHQQQEVSPTADQELSLEAQLCRNMHQMLALEKQKSKLKKSFKEIKKYLQRCKSWLSDKQALCELHMMTLDATKASMKSIYDDTLKRQDAYIQKLLDDNNKENTTGAFADDTFAQGSDLQALLASVPPDVSQKYDELPSHAGPGATLNALRGLPFRDSFCLSKAPSRDGKGRDDTKIREDIAASGEHDRSSSPRGGNRKEIVIQTHDDAASVNSALSDPDEDPTQLGIGIGEPVISADSVSGKIAFGEDAPWLMAGDDEKKPREKLSKTNGNTQHPEKSFDKASTMVAAEANGPNGVQKENDAALSSKEETPVAVADE